MAMISMGDMAQTFVLRQMSTNMKQDATTAAKELATGRSADVGRKLAGELAPLNGIETSLSRLNGYKVATDNAALTANAMQNVFENINRLTENLGTSLLNAGTMESTRTLSTLANDAAQRFESVLTALNTTVGGRSLFAGVANDSPAVASPDVILTALETAITAAGAVTADDINTTVTAWFQSPTGFGAIGYTGGTGAARFAISSDDKADLAITAADPALRDTLKSLALVALVDRATVVPNSGVAADLARAAGTSLLQSASDRASLQGRLGLTQARIDQAQTRNTAEQSMLEIARADLVAIDPFEAATRMEAAQTQLETLYSVTARLSRLSLVDFLR